MSFTCYIGYDACELVLTLANGNRQCFENLGYLTTPKKNDHITVINLQGFGNLEGFALNLMFTSQLETLKVFATLYGFALTVRNLQGFGNLEGFVLNFFCTDKS